MRKLVVPIGILLALLSSILIINRRIQVNAETRARYFIHIVCLLNDQIIESGVAPENLETILDMSPEMMTPFPEGLVYKKTGEKSFILSEADDGMVSLFEMDRIVCDSRTGIHWENSGKKITHFDKTSP